MPDRAAIEVVLRETALARGSITIEPLRGGCIHRVYLVRMDGGAVVAKVAGAGDRTLLEEEAIGLTALRDTGAVLVPEVHALETSGAAAVLIMTALDPQTPDDAAWARLGRDLAALHAVDAGKRYGFASDNHLGRTPQPNGWSDDWSAFNAEHRIGHQRRLASRRLTKDEDDLIRSVERLLPSALPARPRPALLHGDLWSGNAVATRDEQGLRIGLLDPAVSIGDGLADLAMMKLFGGFPEACFAAYCAASDLAEIDAQRIRIYQLYHVLNHVTLFGRGYVGQAMRLAREILDA